MQRIEMDRLTGPYGLLSPSRVENMGLSHADVETFCQLNGDKIVGDAQQVLLLNKLKINRPVLPLSGDGGRAYKSLYVARVKLDRDPVQFAPFSGTGPIDDLGEGCLRAVNSLIGDIAPEIEWMTAKRNVVAALNSTNLVEHWSMAVNDLVWTSRVEEKTSENGRDRLALTAITEGVLAYLVTKPVR